jgi:hypothetical protein
VILFDTQNRSHDQQTGVAGIAPMRKNAPAAFLRARRLARRPCGSNRPQAARSLRRYLRGARASGLLHLSVPQAQDVDVAEIRNGVAEITLNDGLIIHATLHVTSVEPNSRKPGAVDVSYHVVTEVVAAPDPLMDPHETLQ